MRLDRQGWRAVAEVSRSVAERAITEREASLVLWERIGGDPRRYVRAIRVGVKLFSGEARCPRYAAGLAQQVRRLRDARPR